MCLSTSSVPPTERSVAPSRPQSFTLRRQVARLLMLSAACHTQTGVSMAVSDATVAACYLPTPFSLPFRVSCQSRWRWSRRQGYSSSLPTVLLARVPTTGAPKTNCLTRPKPLTRLPLCPCFRIALPPTAPLVLHQRTYSAVFCNDCRVHLCEHCAKVFPNPPLSPLLPWTDPSAPSAAV